MKQTWERKVIHTYDIVMDSMEMTLSEYRDWILGGANYEWRYHKDEKTGDLILERR